uniref:Uncharacterized protein n=1 Tax=Timema poppense TaxID=170557 RepID=A0A7R9GYP7_TIMPO|nr:unnamed protein product [Timema poppensis]
MVPRETGQGKEVLHLAAWNHHRFRLVTDRVLSRQLAGRPRAVSCSCRRVEVRACVLVFVLLLIKGVGSQFFACTQGESRSQLVLKQTNNVFIDNNMGKSLNERVKAEVLES